MRISISPGLVDRRALGELGHCLVRLSLAGSAKLANGAQPFTLDPAGVITLVCFRPFVWFYMRQPVKLDYLASLCMLGAVYFMFRSPCEHRHPSPCDALRANRNLVIAPCARAGVLASTGAGGLFGAPPVPGSRI
jgi:hypothetical protein